MQFTKVILSVLGFVACTQAASLAIQNKDRNDYVMCFVPNIGSNSHGGVYVHAGERVVTGMDNGWAGVIFTIYPGEDAIQKCK